MNKQFVLFLAVLLISCASANFLNLILDNYNDNGLDNGEDEGEQQFGGAWTDAVSFGYGIQSDEGEYFASLQTHDNGEWEVNGTFKRFVQSYIVDQDGGDEGEVNHTYYDKIKYNGEFTYQEYNASGRKITKEDVIPIILKRIKGSNLKEC